MLTYGSLGFGILAVVAPLVLYRARRAEVPIFLSMASLACVAAVMGTSALGGDDSMFYDTAPGVHVLLHHVARAGACHQRMAVVAVRFESMLDVRLALAQ